MTKRMKTTTTIDGEFSGRPQQYEIGRYTYPSGVEGWEARHVGSLGWYSGRDLETALRNASYETDGPTPEWITRAVEEVSGGLR